MSTLIGGTALRDERGLIKDNGTVRGLRDGDLSTEQAVNAFVEEMKDGVLDNLAVNQGPVRDFDAEDALHVYVSGEPGGVVDLYTTYVDQLDATTRETFERDLHAAARSALADLIAQQLADAADRDETDGPHPTIQSLDDVKADIEAIWALGKDLEDGVEVPQFYRSSESEELIESDPAVLTADDTSVLVLEEGPRLSKNPQEDYTPEPGAVAANA